MAKSRLRGIGLACCTTSAPSPQMVTTDVHGVQAFDEFGDHDHVADEATAVRHDSAVCIDVVERRRGLPTQVTAGCAACGWRLVLCDVRQHDECPPSFASRIGRRGDKAGPHPPNASAERIARETHVLEAALIGGSRAVWDAGDVRIVHFADKVVQIGTAQ